MHRRVQHPVELERAGLLVILVFVARPFGDLDDHMDDVGQVRAGVQLVPQVHGGVPCHV